MTPKDVLILSGLPGSGKTTFAKWLEAHGWQRIEHDRLSSSALDQAWLRLLGRMDVDSFLAAASISGQEIRPIVVEWGFPPEVLPRARDLMAAGFNGWWFDGDRKAALKCWRLGHGSRRRRCRSKRSTSR